MADKIQAIVIKASDRKEKDKNILLFSIEKGKFWATLKGVKSVTAKMKVASNLFCFGEFVIEDGKAGRIVTGFETIESFYELSQDVDKYFSAVAMLEVVNAMEFSSVQETAQIFVLLLKALKTLCFSDAKPTYVLNKFFIEFFNISGSPLNIENCSCCGSKAFDKLYINYQIGELVCIGCKNYNCEELPKNAFLALKFLKKVDFDKLSTLVLAQDSEISLLKILVKSFEIRYDKKLKMMGILS